MYISPIFAYDSLEILGQKIFVFLQSDRFTFILVNLS